MFDALRRFWARVWRRWVKRPALEAGSGVVWDLHDPAVVCLPETEAAMSDGPTELWLARLRAEVPFPQPAYGAVEAPGSVREVQARIREATAEVLAGVARARAGAVLEDGDEPDWFVALADRLVPTAAWLVGVGATGGMEVPEKIREVAERVQKVPMLKGVLGNLGELVASVPQLFEQNTQQLAQTQGSYFLLLRAHLEAVLGPLAGEGGTVEVRFDVPALGQRVAELVPPPVPGSPTGGTVGRVLCPAVRVRVVPGGEGEPVSYARGAHVRGR